MKSLVLAAMMMVGSQAFGYSEIISCDVNQAGLSVNNISIVAGGNSGSSVTVSYADGSVEKLALVAGVAGPFGEVRFPTVMFPSSKPTEGNVLQVASANLGTIQAKYRCDRPLTHLYCDTRGDGTALSALATVNVAGRQLKLSCSRELR